MAVRSESLSETAQCSLKLKNRLWEGEGEPRGFPGVQLPKIPGDLLILESANYDRY